MFCSNCGTKLEEGLCPKCGPMDVQTPKKKDKRVLKIFLMLLMMFVGICIFPGIINALIMFIEVLINGVPSDLENVLDSSTIVLGMFIPPLLITIFLLIYKRKEIKVKIKDFINNFGHYMFYICAMVIIILGVNLIANYLITIVSPESMVSSENQQILEGLFNNNTGIYSILFITSVTVFTPIHEEYFCRYIVKKYFKGPVSYVLITSLFFGLFHVFPTSIVTLIQFFNYAIMGAVMAYTYYKTDNIFTSILIHVLNNSIATIFM